MSHPYQNTGDFDTIPMHQFNPAFQSASLERQSALPPDGTHYEFATYGYPETRAHLEPPGPELHRGGFRSLHRTQTTDNRYGDNRETKDDIAMENLLKRLPSRQLESAANNAAKTLHRRHSRNKSRHGAIYHSTLRDGDLEDMIGSSSLLDADEEERVEEAIRSTPATMATRRSMIQKLSSRKRKSPGFMKRMNYSIGMGWKHFKDNMAELKYTMQLWHSHLKKIEGHFGTNVLSYFVFLKWLLLINIPTLLLTLGFIVAPQIIYRWLQQDTLGYISSEKFSGMELLTGAGWFEPTELYYGYYTNKTIQVIGSKSYKMQVAYLFTCGGYYLLTIIILGQSILSSYRKYYIEAGGFQSMQIVFKVLCSWDHGLTSAEAVKLKHKSVYLEFKEYLAGANKDKMRKTMIDRCKLFWLRVFTNVVVLVLIGASGYLVFYLSGTQLNRNTLFSNQTTSAAGVSTNETKNPWLLLVLPLCIGLIHRIMPIMFDFIEGYEQYEIPKSELYMHLSRSMVLRVTTLSVLVIYWYTEVSQSPDVPCWETFMGQELYRLVIVDFIFTLFSTLISELIRRLLVGRVKRVTHPTFALARNTLELIYSQALCWLGTFFAPLLSLIVIIKLIIIFYIKMISVLQNCKPSERPWRATWSHTIFLGYLFLFYLLTTVAVACGIIFIKPSIGCGPYQGKDVMYSVVPELVDSWKEEYAWISTVIYFVSSPGFIAAILVALGMGVYMIRTIMMGRQEAVQRLKQQLVLEGKDKTFLLNLLNQVTERHTCTSVSTTVRPLTQQISPQDDIVSPGGRVFVRSLAESTLGGR
ncbi:transmembrane channel-like protein 5 isoform X2 [Littorina saxatilis]|uniref:TMC domain-containing protein n=1 Tax=Littorina saxatilis TaxID=31220 RepID=A0AAN9BVW1_9CAEN